MHGGRHGPVYIELAGKLGMKGVLASGYGPQLIRFVTHLYVSREQCQQAIAVVESVCGSN